MNAKNHLRIIWTIANKDIQDAVKNKVIVAILVSVLFLMLSSQAIGFIAKISEEPVAYLYDPGNSRFLKDLAPGSELLLVKTASVEDMRGRVGASPDPALGIVLPSDLDQRIAAGETVTLDSYASHRLNAEDITGLLVHFETGLRETGAALKLNADPSPAYPPAESSNYPMMIGFGLVIGVMAIGMILTPFLLLDEKSSHTLDALMVSPAGYTHLMAGKLITGIVYSLTGSLIVLIISRDWIVHWEVLSLAILAGATCAAVLGLLLGTIFTHSTGLNMVGGILIATIMLPMYFWPRLSTRLTPVVSNLVSAIPSIPMYRLVRLSMIEFPDTTAVLGQLSVLALFCLLALLLLGLRVRQLSNR